MTPVQEQNVRWQEVFRARMDQAAERRAEATTQAEWDHAEKVFQSAAKDWQEAVREGAEMANTCHT
jgi:hypothetical protein